MPDIRLLRKDISIVSTVQNKNPKLRIHTNFGGWESGGHFLLQLRTDRQTDGQTKNNKLPQDSVHPSFNRDEYIPLNMHRFFGEECYWIGQIL